MFFTRFGYSQLPTEDRIIISRYTLTALLFVGALGAVRGSVPAISKIVILGGIDPILYAASISLFGGLLLILVNRPWLDHTVDNAGRAVLINRRICRYHHSTYSFL